MIASAIGRPSVPARTTECRVAAHGDPQTGSGSCTGRGYTGWSSQRRAVPSRPGDRLAGAHRQQQVELLGEQLVVVGEVVAEQRERLDERPASGHDLRAAAGQQVQRRELLEDPDRVVVLSTVTALVSRIRRRVARRPRRGSWPVRRRRSRRGGARRPRTRRRPTSSASAISSTTSRTPLGRAHPVGVRAHVGEGVHTDLHDSPTVRRRASGRQIASTGA